MLEKITKPELFILISILILNFSCQTENIEQRTFEQELRELETILENRIEKGVDIDTTDRRVFYYVIEDGHGPFPLEGDTCYIAYLGYLPGGALFYNSQNYYKDGIWKFLYKTPDIIPGLEDGIGQMNKGAKIEIIIPSPLAYGSSGTDIIPPYTTLIYILEMHDLRPRAE